MTIGSNFDQPGDFPLYKDLLQQVFNFVNRSDLPSCMRVNNFFNSNVKAFAFNNLTQEHINPESALIKWEEGIKKLKEGNIVKLKGEELKQIFAIKAVFAGYELFLQKVLTSSINEGNNELCSFSLKQGAYFTIQDHLIAQISSSKEIQSVSVDFGDLKTLLALNSMRTIFFEHVVAGRKVSLFTKLMNLDCVVRQHGTNFIQWLNHPEFKSSLKEFQSKISELVRKGYSRCYGDVRTIEAFEAASKQTQDLLENKEDKKKRRTAPHCLVS